MRIFIFCFCSSICLYSSISWSVASNSLLKNLASPKAISVSLSIDNPKASRLRRLKERTSPAGIAAQKRYRDKAFRERGKKEYGRTPKDNLIYDFTRSADATNGRLKYVKSSLPKDGRLTRASMKKLKFKDTETGKIIDYKNVKNF